MTETVTLMPGMILWTKGENEFSDGAVGGAFIRRSHDPETGEELATILTFQAAKPRQASLQLVDGKGGYRDLGLVARLIRVPMSEIRTPHDDHRDADKCALYARKALMAAHVPPCDKLDSPQHAAMLDAYRILRDEAVLLHRGVA